MTTSQDQTYPSNNNGHLDERVAATCKVWRSMLPLMLVSLVFVFAFKMVLLPIVLILGATLTAMAIWMFAGERVEGTSKRERALMKRITDLEARLENIETLSRMEMSLSKREESDQDEQ